MQCPTAGSSRRLGPEVCTELNHLTTRECCKGNGGVPQCSQLNTQTNRFLQKMSSIGSENCVCGRFVVVVVVVLAVVVVCLFVCLFVLLVGWLVGCCCFCLFVCLATFVCL